MQVIYLVSLLQKKYEHYGKECHARRTENGENHVKVAQNDNSKSVLLSNHKSFRVMTGSDVGFKQ